MEMSPLNQEIIELMLQNKLEKQPPVCVIYFTAKWCGPCNRLPLDKIIQANSKIAWYLCDIDENDYTAGYCGIKSIPTFMPIVNGKAYQPLTSSDPEKIILSLRNL
jgi:thioredoxin-like negative regulator of GroEL